MSASILKDTSTDALPISSPDTNSSRPDGSLSDDGRFQWVAAWRQWVPTGKETQLELPGLPPSGPQLSTRHSDSCLCAECATKAQRIADYLKNRDLWGNGGL